MISEVLNGKYKITTSTNPEEMVYSEELNGYIAFRALVHGICGGVGVELSMADVMAMFRDIKGHMEQVSGLTAKVIVEVTGGDAGNGAIEYAKKLLEEFDHVKAELGLELDVNVTVNEAIHNNFCTLLGQEILNPVAITSH